MNELRMKELRWFLLRTFGWILAAVGIVEYLLQVLLDRLLLPTLSEYLDFEAVTALMSGGARSFAALLLALLAVILQIFSALLDDSAGWMLRWSAKRIEQGVWSLVSVTNAGILQLDAGRQRWLFLFWFAEAVVLLLPFAVGAVVYARIVTREIAKLEKEREEARREYDRKRNLMLSDIAHDLRTPITTVAGYAAALSQGLAEPERVQEYLDAIQHKTARMNELITLLFDYVKLDSAGFALNRTRLELGELLRENAALVYSDIEAAEMELTVMIPEERVELDADALQLSRVITNLLINAVRHNPPKTQIALSLIREDECVRIIVADSGSLLDEAVRENLFEPFARGDRARSGGGSGLGLSIAKKVVEMHGGSLFFIQQDKMRGRYGLDCCTKAFMIVLPFA